MPMIEGWLLDVHANKDNTGMMVWVIDDDGLAHACEVPWQPVIHVHASHDDLNQLDHWLEQPEIRQRFRLNRPHVCLLYTSPSPRDS